MKFGNPMRIGHILDEKLAVQFERAGISDHEKIAHNDKNSLTNHLAEFSQILTEAIEDPARADDVFLLTRSSFLLASREKSLYAFKEIEAVLTECIADLEDQDGFEAMREELIDLRHEAYGYAKSYESIAHRNSDPEDYGHLRDW